VVHVAETGLAAAKDAEILSRARAEDRTEVTLDADFHALLMVNRRTSPSVIRLRLEGLKGRELAGILETVLTAVSHDLGQGALVTVTRRSIRVHRLKQDTQS
jgi:predicted nuclease of predicted toxin-antitoxin system